MVLARERRQALCLLVNIIFLLKGMIPDSEKTERLLRAHAVRPYGPLCCFFWWGEHRSPAVSLLVSMSITAAPEAPGQAGAGRCRGGLRRPFPRR